MTKDQKKKNDFVKTSECQCKAGHSFCQHTWGNGGDSDSATRFTKTSYFAFYSHVDAPLAAASMQGTTWEQFRVKCLAQGHNGRLGGGRI